MYGFGFPTSFQSRELGEIGWSLLYKLETNRSKSNLKEIKQATKTTDEDQIRFRSVLIIYFILRLLVKA